MKYLILAIVPLSSAFVIKQAIPSEKSLYSSSTFEISENFDLERAQECAEHFGQCSLDEIEELRDSVHDARLRDTIVSDMTHGDAKSKVIVERILEDELTLQLNLLKQEMTGSTLFPEEEMTESTLFPEEKMNHESTPAANIQAMNFMNESVFESLAICAVAGLMLYVAPHM